MTSMADLTARAETLAAELAFTLAKIRAETRAVTPHIRPGITPTLLTVKQAAEALGMSRSGIYGLITSGELDSVRIGSRRRVPVHAIEVYVAALTAAR